MYRYYVCSRASKEGWDKCPSPSLPAAEVEKFVIEEIARIGDDADLCQQVIAQHEKNREREITEATVDHRKLQQQLEAIAKKLRKASTEVDVTTLAECQRQQAEVEARLVELDARREVLQENNLSADELQAAVKAFLPAWESLTLQERIRLLKLLIQKVTYDGTLGELAITFRPNGIKAIETEATV